jgi:hypothetical protein
LVGPNTAFANSVWLKIEVTIPFTIDKPQGLSTVISSGNELALQPLNQFGSTFLATVIKFWAAALELAHT